MNLAEAVFALPPEVVSALGVLAAFALSSDQSADQVNALGNFLMLIGQVMSTLSAQISLQQASGQQDEIAALWQAVRRLEQRAEATERKKSRPTVCSREKGG